MQLYRYENCNILPLKLVIRREKPLEINELDKDGHKFCELLLTTLSLGHSMSCTEWSKLGSKSLFSFLEKKSLSLRQSYLNLFFYK